MPQESEAEGQQPLLPLEDVSGNMEPCSHRRAGRMSRLHGHSSEQGQQGALQVATDCLMRAGHFTGAPKDSDFLVKLSFHRVGGAHPAHKFEAGGSPVSGHHGPHSEILSQKQEMARVAHVFNPSNWETEAGGSEFKASLGYRVRKNSMTARNPGYTKKSCLKKKIEKTKKHPQNI